MALSGVLWIAHHGSWMHVAWKKWQCCHEAFGPLDCCPADAPRWQHARRGHRLTRCVDCHGRGWHRIGRRRPRQAGRGGTAVTSAAPGPRVGSDDRTQSLIENPARAAASRLAGAGVPAPQDGPPLLLHEAVDQVPGMQRMRVPRCRHIRGTPRTGAGGRPPQISSRPSLDPASARGVPAG